MKKSRYEIVQDLMADPNVNYIQVDYKGKAKNHLASMLRELTGETVDHVKKSCIMAGRMVSKNSPNLMLTMARDTGSRNSDGEFDFRSLVLAGINPDTFEVTTNVDKIFYCENFKAGYKEIDLTNCPVFRKPTGTTRVAAIATLVDRGSLILTISKLTSKIDALKKKLGKDSETISFGHRFFYEPPSGKTEKIFDENDNPVKTEVVRVSKGLRLEHKDKAPYEWVMNEINDAKDVLAINRLWQIREDLKKTLSEWEEKVRPWELGLIEHSEKGDTVKAGTVTFEVLRPVSKEYGYSKDTLRKLKTGAYKMKEVDISRGKWICEPISVPSSQEVEVEETVEA